MDTFRCVKRREDKPQTSASSAPSELILNVYDAMAEAIRTGVPYQTILDPPPGHGPRHPARENT